MSLFKKSGSKVWYYDFKFKGRTYRGSTYQRNIEQARRVQAKVRSDAAFELFGIAAPKAAQLFKHFMATDKCNNQQQNASPSEKPSDEGNQPQQGQFLNYVRHNNSEKPATVEFYEEKAKRLLEYTPFAEAPLDHIDEQMIEDFRQWRSKQKKRSSGPGLMSKASINRELATLRKALRLAKRFKLIDEVPPISIKVSGERTRDYILDGATETRYLGLVRYPLLEAAILLVDLGVRPHELVQARKQDVLIQDKLFRVIDGKTGPRTIPIPDRSLETIQFLFQLHADSPWLFPGQRKGRHLTVWALDNLHAAVREAGGFPVEFVLYSCRHTFGTRLAESGASAWEIQKLMGHSSVKTSEKYIHIGDAGIERAMRRKQELDRMIRGEVHKETLKEEN